MQLMPHNTHKNKFVLSCQRYNIISQTPIFEQKNESSRLFLPAALRIYYILQPDSIQAAISRPF